tara:strand:+ start:596 stop:976 length:381 start_codon:yes stop_codon:yes gene_type:complete
MIPEATHIAAAAKHDGMVIRETDLSMRIETGWASAGRFTTYAEEDEQPRMGFWLCHAVEKDNEWEMNLAIVSKHSQIFSALEEIHIDDDRVKDSFTYLIHGTVDEETIAIMLQEDQKVEEEEEEEE